MSFESSFGKETIKTTGAELMLQSVVFREFRKYRTAILAAAVSNGRISVGPGTPWPARLVHTIVSRISRAASNEIDNRIFERAREISTSLAYRQLFDEVRKGYLSADFDEERQLKHVRGITELFIKRFDVNPDPQLIGCVAAISYRAFRECAQASKEASVYRQYAGLRDGFIQAYSDDPFVLSLIGRTPPRRRALAKLITFFSNRFARSYFRSKLFEEVQNDASEFLNQKAVGRILRQRSTEGDDIRQCFPNSVEIGAAKALGSNFIFSLIPDRYRTNQFFFLGVVLFEFMRRDITEVIETSISSL